MPYIIDNDTGQILNEAAIDENTNSTWITPDTHYRNGSPQGFRNHGQTRTSGAFADAVDAIRYGFSIGDFGG